ncbi:hypothetical protein [Petroclostridium sp. X23]|nr:hypothetical protein [Petroclostridium sp. X23]WHH57883.1 hypothetical protein QKW49_19020 [Petroclostridium sp. X23]
MALEYGAHMLQGYYFAKPDFIDSGFIASLNSKVNVLPIIGKTI